MIETIVSKVIALWRDDRGVDLIEYALIASVIAIAGVLAFPQIYAKLDSAFSRWGGNVYDAWEPADPE